MRVSVEERSTGTCDDVVVGRVRRRDLLGTWNKCTVWRQRRAIEERLSDWSCGRECRLRLLLRFGETIAVKMCDQRMARGLSRCQCCCCLQPRTDATTSSTPRFRDDRPGHNNNSRHPGPSAIKTRHDVSLSLLNIRRMARHVLMHARLRPGTSWLSQIE